MPTIGGYELSSIPIPSANQEQQQPIIELVNTILQVKKENPNSNTLFLEQQIDLLVYRLYNLTYDEICVIDPETPIMRKEYEETKLKIS